MNTIRRITVVLAAVLALVAGLVATTTSPASARPVERYGNQTNCGKSGTFSATANFDAFVAHSIHAAVTECDNGTQVKWAANPVVTFPSRFPYPGEDITLVAGPNITDTNPAYGGGVGKIRWTISVKQTTMKVGNQTFDYYVYVSPAGVQICAVSGGRCGSLARLG